MYCRLSNVMVMFFSPLTLRYLGSFILLISINAEGFVIFCVLGLRSSLVSLVPSLVRESCCSLVADTSLRVLASISCTKVSFSMRYFSNDLFCSIPSFGKSLNTLFLTSALLNESSRSDSFDSSIFLDIIFRYLPYISLSSSPSFSMFSESTIILKSDWTFDCIPSTSPRKPAAIGRVVSFLKRESISNVLKSFLNLGLKSKPNC